ncbi:major facilitator superfamily domain-containing protein [Suillus clintonianus]|uniref:major facilitator superfamily domain-containing protein n=1 Tax=Suillus clintonianus TaxID=1904413 RepID=UPI001B87163A|nr:major facilitator superfamily domain-containing protein [Suillus clintonianus]KAG2153184.1 major facilitator superfamily domain-containing protein [Suillus clintonianus]
MDTSNSPGVPASDTTPLIPAGGSKKPKTPLPKLQIGILMALQLMEPIASTSIFPYINQLIRELGITGGDDAAVGYYAGIIVGAGIATCENGFFIGYDYQESLFFAAQALTTLRWSRLSDRIGRKPVLVIGLSGGCISMLCFGLSTTFWSLVISRCMSGFLNGNVGVMKTMVGELTDSTNMAQAFAFFPIVWCIGGSVGPLMGGTLARPQDRWPALFAGSFWGQYPYFLPCAVAACLFLVAILLMSILLEETLSTKRQPRLTSTTTGVSSSADTESIAQQSMANMPLRDLLTPTVVIPIANYAMLAFLDISFRVLLPLFFSTPTYLGGLGFSPSSIGSWLALFGIVDGVFQALFFAKIVDWLSAKRLFFLVVVWHLAYGTIFLFITASAPSNNVLGAINGLGQTSASVARAVGPALATSLFALSKEHNILGGNAVYVVLIMLAGLFRWLASQLPDLQDRDE